MEGIISSVTGTGTRGLGMLVTYSGLVAMIVETKFALAFLGLLIIADFRYGWGESKKRYIEAKRLRDERRMDLYKIRWSRAVRKSCNKLVDYVLIMALGMAAGYALLEPLGISHVFGAFGASMLLAMCEVSSIFGHFFYLHGIKVERNGVKGFFKALAVALARIKNPDVGDALNEAFNEMEKEGGEHVNGN